MTFYVMLEANILINFICVNRNFDYPHITVVIFVPRKQSKKPRFSPINIVFVEKVFDMYLLLGWFSLFSQNFPKKLLLVCTFEKLTKNILFDCFGVLSLIFEKSQTFKVTKESGKIGTNMDIILLFLGKPLDKHGIALVHITYPPLAAWAVRNLNRT